MAQKQTDIDYLINNNVNIRGRKYYLNAEIDDDELMELVKWLDFFERTEGTITIVINSPGGCINAGLGMYDWIKRCSNHIKIEVVGSVSSMAAVLLQAGDERLIGKHARFMVHRGSFAVNDNFKEAKAAVVETEKLVNILADLLYKRIREKKKRYKREDLETLLDTDSYMSAKETLDLGLCDGLY